MSEAPIFRPTPAEFQNFQAFIASIEPVVAKAGIAKIIPPDGWKARENYDNLDFLVTKPGKQHRTGSKGVFEQIMIEGRSMPLRQFRENGLADDTRYGHLEPMEMERRFWKNAGILKPVYGADLHMTLFDPSVKDWNLNHLQDPIMRRIEDDIPGVTSPYIYIGAHLTSFAWHVEDMDLYSINYLHHGLPKFWYSISPDYGAEFEDLVRSHFPELARDCKAFLRHKTILLSPRVLEARRIPYNIVVQREGEFVVTMPYAYHAGFNFGFNVAEAVNFATERWVAYGRKSVKCNCRDINVWIDMSLFNDIEDSFLGCSPTNGTVNASGQLSAKCARCNKTRQVKTLPLEREFRCSVIPGMTCSHPQAGIEAPVKQTHLKQTKEKKQAQGDTTHLNTIPLIPISSSPVMPCTRVFSSLLFPTESLTEPSVNVVADDDLCQWVQCDLCDKWRILSSGLSADKFKDSFHCDMIQGCDCNIPEDSMDDHVDLTHALDSLNTPTVKDRKSPRKSPPGNKKRRTPNTPKSTPSKARKLVLKTNKCEQNTEPELMVSLPAESA